MNQIIVVFILGFSLFSMVGCNNAVDGSFGETSISFDRTDTSSVKISEGSGYQIQFQMKGASDLSEGLRVDWTILNGEDDFDNSSGMSMIYDANSVVTISLNPKVDASIDPGEQFIFRLYSSENKFPDLEIPVEVEDQTTDGLLVVTGAPFNFGSILVSFPLTQLVTVTNSGDATVTFGSLSSDDIQFSYAGGGFPGTLGTCTAQLSGGASCQLELEFTPSGLGLQSANFSLNYDNGRINDFLGFAGQGTGTGITASISGAPSGSSNITALNIDIGGLQVQSYSYKLGAAGSTDCSVAGGYSGEIVEATNITDNISSDISYPQGLLRLCVVAKSIANVWQSYASASSVTWTKDTVSPTLSIGAASVGSINSGDTVNFPITIAGGTTFNLQNSDITVNGTNTGCTPSVTNGTTATPTVSVTGCSGNGSITITVAAGSATDAAGNSDSGDGPSGSVTVDNTGPSISFGAPTVAAINAGDTTDIGLTITGATTINVQNSDIAINGANAGCSASVANGTTATPTVTVSGCTGDGAMTISVAAAAAQDALGNDNASEGPSASVTVDNTGPTVTWAVAPVAAVGNSSVFIIYTSTVVGGSTYNLTNGDVTANGALSSCSAPSVFSGTTSTPGAFLMTCSGDGTGSITYSAGVFHDALGNPNLASTSPTFTVDNTAPTVSIGSPSVGTTSASVSVDFPITFNNGSTYNLTSGKVTISGNNTGCIASVANGTTASPTVTVSGCTTDGSITISIGTTSVYDAAGNGNALTGPSASVTVDNPPTLIIGTPTLSLINSSTTVDFPINIYGSSSYNLQNSDITVNGANGGCSANVTNGNTATPTVSVSGCTGNGSMTITVAGGSSTDGSLFDSGDGPSASVTVDNIAPTLSIGAPSVGAITIAQTVDFPVTIAGASTINLTSGDVTVNDNDCSPSISNGTTATPTVTLSGCSLNTVTSISIAANVGNDGINGTAADGPSGGVTVSGGEDPALSNISSGYSLSTRQIHLTPGGAQTVTVNFASPAVTTLNLPYKVYGMFQADWDDILDEGGELITVNQGDTSISFDVSFPASPNFTDFAHMNLILDTTDTLNSQVDVALYGSSVQSQFTIAEVATNHGCGITPTGELYCWGQPSSGKVGNGVTTGVQNERIQIGVSTGWTEVGVGTAYSCGIDTGALYCWGSDFYGQQGNGATTGDVLTPTQVGVDTNWTEIAAGDTSICAIESGRLFCWGSDINELTGNGATTGNVISPTQVGVSTTWTQVNMGGGNACGIDNGDLYCWGRDSDGQVGNGSGASTTVDTPELIDSSGTWTAAFAGGNHSCGINAGDLYCWGQNFYGQLGISGTSDRHTPQLIDNTGTWSWVTLETTYTCGIKAAGELYCWGRGNYGQLGNPDYSTLGSNFFTPTRVGTGTNWTHVDADGNGVVGVNNGHLISWGRGFHNNIGAGGFTGQSQGMPEPSVLFPETDWTHYVGSSFGTDNVCGIRGGELYCWGESGYGHSGAVVHSPQRVGTKNNWTALDMGYTHACGIESGELYCWGTDTNGKLGIAVGDDSTSDPTRVGLSSSWTHVGVGTNHTCGINAGALYCWGSDTSGKIGNGPGTTTNVETPQQIGVSTGWTELNVSSDMACAIDAGNVYCWGRNFQNGLGHGSTGDRDAPEQITFGGTWSGLSLEYYSGCALSGGSPHCWGYNSDGQVGDGTTTNATSPVQVSLSTTFTKVSVGQTATCALDAGALYCWGDNVYGFHLDGTTADKLTPTQIGVSTAWSNIICNGLTCHGFDSGGVMTSAGEVRQLLHSVSITPND